MISRQQIFNELKEFFFNEENIIAVWEAGSAATGYLDEHSDMDISAVYEDESVEILFCRLESFLKEHYGIERKYRVPEPAWHGFSQCFYKLRNTYELFYLDISLIKRSIPDKFTDTDRHGNAILWFEKEKIFDPLPAKVEAVIEKGKRFYKIVSKADFLTVIELKKALKRGIYAESFMNYYQLIRSLATLLNLKYRPAKVDFSLRYAYRDYPEEEYAFLENALKIVSIEEIKNKLETVLEKYDTVKKELGKDWS